MTSHSDDHWLSMARIRPLSSPAQELSNRIGDWLYDPEPQYEPALEDIDKGKLQYLEELLKEIIDNDTNQHDRR